MHEELLLAAERDLSRLATIDEAVCAFISLRGLNLGCFQVQVGRLLGTVEALIGHRAYLIFKSFVNL